jgi:hypothetical protein
MTYDPDEFYDAEADVQAILQRPYQININQFFDRSMAIFQQKAGELVGFTVITIIVSAALSSIPYVGDILSGIASSVLAAGYYFFIFRLSRGQTAEFSDFFAGFKNNQFVPVFLVNLLIGLVAGGVLVFSCVFIGLGVYRPMASFFEQIRETSPTPEEIPQLPDLPIPPAVSMGLLLVGLLLLIPFIYLSISYMFAPLLVVDRRLGAWQAMETSRKLIGKRWWGWWGFSILVGLIQMVGFFACCIGLLISLPVGYCAIAAAYEQVVGVSQHNSLPDADELG